VASIAGVGDVQDGALIRYAATGGPTEGVVLDQSDPTVWVDDGNAALLTLTVQPIGSEDTLDVSGDRVREVVAGPDEHSHASDVETLHPDGPEDVTGFIERHDRREFVVEYSEGDGAREVTATVTDALGALLMVRVDGGELGIPYASLDSVRVPGGDSDD